MFRLVSLTVATMALGAFSASAEMSQPAQDGVAIWAYPQAENYCPSGLQPVRIGGVVCCGTPTHTGYGDAPAPRVRSTYVAYGKGASDYIAYSKSPNDPQ